MALADTLKEFLADTVAFRIKAQMMHWNVEGEDFVELHQLFGTIYEDANDATDTIAEYIRSLNEFAPGSLSRFAALTDIVDQLKVPNAQKMVEELLSDILDLIDDTKVLFDDATTAKENGIANFAADRQSQLGKFAWQLRSYLA